MAISVSAERHVTGSEGAGGFGRFAFIREESQVVVLLVDFRLSHPLLEGLVPNDSPKGRCLVLGGPILCVPAIRYDSQIYPAIVQSVSVDMVNLPEISDHQTKQAAMHQLSYTIDFALSVTVWMKNPSPLIDQRNIVSIEGCNGAMA